ncbi:MAG: hypothetical protein Q8N18_05775 [Opitutaceae bacterium]|nr:hypothetical protein [Opitutaceae bacterium]
MSSFFRTPRQIARYLASLPFSLHQHLHGESLEINPVDVAALEVLRLMEPAVFERMATRSVVFEESFLGLPPHGPDDESREEKLLDWVVSVATESRKDAVRNLILGLVPQLNRGRNISDAVRDDWDRTKRVCHGNHYDRYFQLVLPAGYVTTSEIDQLRDAAAKGREAIYKELCAFEGQGRLRNVLSRSHVILHDLADPARENVFYALCVLGDRLPELRGYGEDDDFKWTAGNVAIRLLWDISPELRASWIEKALKSEAGLDFPVTFAQRLNRKTESGTVTLQVAPTAAVQIARSAMERIQQAAKDGSLWQSPWLGWHLNFWAEQQGLAAAQEWLAGEVKSSEKALLLVKNLVSVATSNRGYYPRLSAAKLDSYMSLEALLALLPPPRPESPRERDAVIMLEKAVGLKSAGALPGEVKLNDSGF